MWCWRRLLRVPWTARSNQSILKEISLEYSSEGLILKLKLQYLATWSKELTHWERPWSWKRLKAGEGDNRGQDGWMASSTQWTWIWACHKRWWRTGKSGMLQSMAKSRTRLSDWTTSWKMRLLRVSLWWGCYEVQMSKYMWSKQWQTKSKHYLHILYYCYTWKIKTR